MSFNPLGSSDSLLSTRAGPSREGKQTKQLLGALSWPGAPRQRLVMNKTERQGQRNVLGRPLVALLIKLHETSVIKHVYQTCSQMERTREGTGDC